MALTRCDSSLLADCDGYNSDDDATITRTRSFLGSIENLCLDDMDDDTGPTKSIMEQMETFNVQKFDVMSGTSFFRPSDTDFDLALLNRPLLPQNERRLQMVDAVFSVVASPARFMNEPRFNTGKQVLFAARDVSVLATDFPQHMQDFFRSSYGRIRENLRFYPHIDPTLQKVSLVARTRHEMRNGRVIFHYVGYGFAGVTSTHFSVFDGNNFIRCSVADMFVNLGTPSWLIFDCDNAAAVIPTLKQAAGSRASVRGGPERHGTRAADWNDWFCMCATDVDEQLPSDPHLPRDFLTSCLLRPLETAIRCHIVQYYRTSIAADQASMDRVLELLCKEGTPMRSTLECEISAIADAVAADALDPEICRLMFRRDDMMMAMGQRFMLAQYLLRPYQVHPISVPEIADASYHRLWQQWRAVVDLAITAVLSPEPHFSSDLFARACESVKEFLDHKEERRIPPGHLVLMFHIPENSPVRETSYNLLARYAATSERARRVLANVGLFDYVFAAVASNEFHGNTFHSLCYLTISLLHHEPRFVNDLHKDFDVKHLPARFFDETVSVGTRILVGAIMTSILPHCEGVRDIAVRPEFLKSTQKLLETSGPGLSLWGILVQRRMFDSFGAEISSFFDISLHIQVATFVCHPSPEVRAAALATIPCFLEKRCIRARGQLFCIAMLCSMDVSYKVRFNYILFLLRFISMYFDSLKDSRVVVVTSVKEIAEFAFSVLGVAFPTPTTFEERIRVTDLVCQNFESADFLPLFISVALFMLMHLADDPHPSIRKSARDFQDVVRQKMKNNQRNSDNTACLSAPPPSVDRDVSSFRGTAPEYERQVITESGGDAMYRICVQQVVSAGCNMCDETDPIVRKSRRATFGYPPSLRLRECNRWKIAGGRPSMIAFHPELNATAIATSTGKVIYDSDKSTPQAMCDFADGISSLHVVSWSDEPLVFAAAEHGGIFGWCPGERHPRIIFRPEFAGNIGPQVLAVPGPRRLLSSRGACGTVRLWDLESERMANEWSTGSDQQITALACDSLDKNLYIMGFANGVLASMDMRCALRDGPVEVARPRVNEAITKIQANVTSDTPYYFCGTASGTFMQWERLDNITIVKEKLPLTDFAVHPTNSIYIMSPQNGYPTVCDFSMKGIHTIRTREYGCCCAVHPILPLMSVAMPNGEIVQYESG